MAASAGGGRPEAVPLRISLLGPFSLSLGEKGAGPWLRPAPRRLCELVLVSPRRRIGREIACEALFANLPPAPAKRALSKALSMARTVLSELGEPGARLLQADRNSIWADVGRSVEVDLERLNEAFDSGMSTAPGRERDALLVAALSEEKTLLEDELYADWARPARDELEARRQEARLTLARDRSRGLGRSGPRSVLAAFEACLAHDPACEEAAAALVRVHAAQGHHGLAATTYERCRAGLAELGLHPSPALEKARTAAYPTSTGLAPSAGSAPPVVRQREDRRLISVLFAELAASAGTGLPPEDLRELVGGSLARVINEVEAFGGTVTSVSGAGLVALFGAPDSHEDDPERALRAGFRVAAGGGDTEALSVRVGVETGQAVVGPIGSGSRVEYGAVGDVVGVAARLQSLAKPASVLVGPATHAATEGLFEWGPTEEVAAPPGAEPLVATHLGRPKARGLRSRAGSGHYANAPLVGRKTELSVFRSALREAISGTGGAVLVVGEPGLGKTCLVGEWRKLFMAWVGAASGRLPLWLEGRGASYASSVPYGLFQQLVSGWIGVSLEEGDAVVRAALERAMSVILGSKDYREDQVALLGRMLGLRSDGGSLDRLSPDGLQRATFGAISDVISRLVAHGPTVLVLEDLHWADPTSLRLTEELSAVSADRPLLLVLTRRPEPDPGASGLEDALGSRLTVRSLELSPLPEDTERDLARALMGEGVPDVVLDAVTEATGGNPLFLEERLSSLFETGALAHDEGGWRFDPAVPTGMPDVLERLVRSRVDRLPDGPGEAVVAASVLGSEFGLRELRAVTDLNGGLPTALAQLCATGLLAEVRSHPEPVYRFRHALIQEAIYKGLLRVQRRHLHARAAWGLEEASTNIDEAAAVLGHHYAMAGEIERAVHYLGLAGDRAAADFANDEAVSSYRSALAVLSQGEFGRADAEAATTMAVDLGLRLGKVLWLIGHHRDARDAVKEALGIVGPEDSFRAASLQALLGRIEVADHRYDSALAAFDAAEELIGEHPEDRDQEAVDLWIEVQLDGRSVLHYWQNEPERGAAVLAAARPVVEFRGSPAQKGSFRYHLALLQARQSRFVIDSEILANTRAALAAAEEAGAGKGESLFKLGLFLLLHGDLDEARQRLEAALAIAEETGDAVLRTRCLCYLNMTALRRGDVEAVRNLAPEATAVAETTAYPEYVATAKATSAWVSWRDGRPAEVVVALADEALALWGTTIVAYPFFWLCLWPLIAVHLADARVSEAVGAARQLLGPAQQRLPDELDSAIRAGIAAWERGEPEVAAGELGGAVAVASDLRFA